MLGREACAGTDQPANRRDVGQLWLRRGTCSLPGVLAGGLGPFLPSDNHGHQRETDEKQGDMQALEPNKRFKHKAKRGVPLPRGLLSGVWRNPGYLQKQKCVWVVAGRCCGVDLGCSPGI